MSGWISLDRAVTGHWIWQGEKFTRGQAWIDLLLWASHSNNKACIKGELIDVNRGEQIRSQVALAKAWNWDRKTVSRFLKLLEKDGMISLRHDHLTSYITICNYNDFQGERGRSTQLKGQQKGQQKGQACTSSRDTINNVNNGNNDNNDNNKPIDQSKIDRKNLVDDAFNYFWSNMKLTKKSKPTGLKAFNKQVKKIDDPMEFAKMLCNDTEERFNSGQFGFDKMHPSTYLNQERWNDELQKQLLPDAPVDCGIDFDALIENFNNSMQGWEGVSVAQKVTPTQKGMIAILVRDYGMTNDRFKAYFDYIAESEKYRCYVDGVNIPAQGLTFFLKEDTIQR